MTFPDRQTRDSVAVELGSQQGEAFWISGDYLTKDNPDTGGYCVTCLYRISQQSIRDSIYNYLAGKVELAVGSGFIEKHLCGHDEGTPCTDSTRVSWGEDDG